MWPDDPEAQAYLFLVGVAVLVMVGLAWATGVEMTKNSRLRARLEKAYKANRSLWRERAKLRALLAGERARNADPVDYHFDTTPTTRHVLPESMSETTTIQTTEVAPVVTLPAKFTGVDGDSVTVHKAGEGDAVLTVASARDGALSVCVEDGQVNAFIAAVCKAAER